MALALRDRQAGCSDHRCNYWLQVKGKLHNTYTERAIYFLYSEDRHAGWILRDVRAATMDIYTSACKRGDEIVTYESHLRSRTCKSHYGVLRFETPSGAEEIQLASVQYFIRVQHPQRPSLRPAWVQLFPPALHPMDDGMSHACLSLKRPGGMCQ